MAKKSELKPTAIELTQDEARAVVRFLRGKMPLHEARKVLGCGDVHQFNDKVNAWLAGQ